MHMSVPGGEADVVYTAVGALMSVAMPLTPAERSDVQEEIMGSLDRSSR